MLPGAPKEFQPQKKRAPEPSGKVLERRKRISDPATKTKLGPEWESTENEGKLFENFEDFKETQEITKTGKVAYKDPNAIEVPVFDIRTLPDYSALGVIGASESGKSNWVAWGLVMNNTHPWYNCFTETAANGFWQKYLPMKAVVQGFDVNRAANTLRHQANVLPQQDTRNVSMCSIMDDLQGTKEWIPPVTALFTRGRHVNIQTFALVQTKNGLFKHMRYNAKGIVVFRTLSHTERLEIAKEWMGDWHPTTATQLICKYTTDHHGLFIDLRTSPPGLYKTKAPDMGELAKQHGAPKPFQIHYPLGSAAFWGNDPRYVKGNKRTTLPGDKVFEEYTPVAEGATLLSEEEVKPGDDQETAVERRAERAARAKAIDPPPLSTRSGEVPLFDF